MRADLRRRFVDHLAKKGFAVEREGARHSIIRTDLGARAPVPHHSDLDPRLVYLITRTLGIPWKGPRPGVDTDGEDFAVTNHDHVVVEQSERGWLVARTLEDESICTQGRTLDEIVVNVRDITQSMHGLESITVELVVSGSILLSAGTERLSREDQTQHASGS